MRSLGLIDFDDILTDTLESFRMGGAKCEALLPRFEYLLVDEFQDIDPIQLRTDPHMGAEKQRTVCDRRPGPVYFTASAARTRIALNV